VKSVVAFEKIILYSELGSFTSNLPLLNKSVLELGEFPTRRSVNTKFKPIKISIIVKNGLKKADDRLKKNFKNRAMPKIKRSAPKSGEENSPICVPNYK
jgi:hypothetical protein